jgi:hypothetical protein
MLLFSFTLSSPTGFKPKTGKPAPFYRAPAAETGGLKTGSYRL